MKKELRIIFTTDYEIFFGSRSGTFEKCIIEPMDGLMSLAARVGIVISVFVDTAMFFRLIETPPKNMNAAGALKKMKEQLRAASAAGHELQIHLHPGWLDAGFENGQWQFNPASFKCGDWIGKSGQNTNPADLIRWSKDFLAGLAADFGSEHDATAFRAGGFCIEPFDTLKQPLIDAGVSIDSSVARGMKIPAQPYSLDHSAAPKKQFWRFSVSPLVEDSSGMFLEIPVTTGTFPLARVLLAIKADRSFSSAEQCGDGCAIPTSSGDSGNIFARALKLRKAFSPFTALLSPDLYPETINRKTIGGAIATRQSSVPLMVFINHTKIFSDHAIYSFERTLDRLRKDYELVPAGIGAFGNDILQAGGKNE